jgi:dihydrodipicolinate synthase/N-acetylneuraminate lyase
LARLEQIRGIFQPVPTPFDGDGEVDEAVFAELVEYCVSSGAHAVFVGGPFGQGPAMNAGQRMRVMDIAFEIAAGRVPVVPDIGAVDPYTARALGQHARSRGALAVAITAPYYFADRSADELIMHFTMIDQAVMLPFLVVTDPPYQGYPISAEFLARIREAAPRLFGAHPAKTGVAELLGYLRTLGPSWPGWRTAETAWRRSCRTRTPSATTSRSSARP